MNSPSETIDDILGFADAEYLKYVNCLLNEKDALYRLDELDDELLKIVSKRPIDVERLCKINAEAYRELATGDMPTQLLAYNYNTWMLAGIFQNKIAEAKSIFLEGILFCKDNKQYEAGQSLSQNVFKIFSIGQMPHDQALYLLAQITEFFKSLNKNEDAVNALCAAAFYFADAGAFQSAYRAIYDAQTIANANKITCSLIQVLETQGMVALLEGDLVCAESEFQKCFMLYKTIKAEPPFELKANTALIMLRKKKYKRARDIYLGMIRDYSTSKDVAQIMQLKMNLLVCLRELMDRDAVDDLIMEVERDLGQCDIEARIEAWLILAKTHLQIKNELKGISLIKAACFEIQGQIDQYQRLHYRRGVREQYLPRIKSLLADVTSPETTSEVLYALAFCSLNGLHDWLSILEWVDVILQSKTVSDSLKKELINKRDSLIRFGTPFLYGFREKYDDPFQFANEQMVQTLGEQVARNLDYSLPWQEFGEIVTQICENYSYPPPTLGASLENAVRIIDRLLSVGSSFIFSFACHEGCVLIFISEGQYLRTIIPSKNLSDFFQILYNYQQKNADRLAFHKELAKIHKALDPTIAKIRTILENSLISELVFIPDHLTEGFPILPGLLDSAVLRARIKKQRFVFRTCPAPKEQVANFVLSGPSLFVLNSEEHLQLAEAEKKVVKEAYANETHVEIDLQYRKIDFSNPPANSARHLHFVTHNTPAIAFTDPSFISTLGPSSESSVWLDSIQREAHNLEFTLVVLNGCSTGTTGNKNYFRVFRTSEKIGLSSVFLLNRRCCVVATQWNEPEIVGYIFSSLFYKALAICRRPSQAFILALVDLYELTKENAIALLDKITDDKIRLKQTDAFRQAKVEFPFRDVYFIGMFQFHSLLERQASS